VPTLYKSQLICKLKLKSGVGKAASIKALHELSLKLDCLH